MLVTVLSPVGGAGKTTVALSLCRAATLAGKRALAVELDFSPGAFRALFDLGRAPGVVDAWQVPRELPSLAVPVREGFDVLPGGSPEDEDAVEDVTPLLGAARAAYDLVVADTGKLTAAVADAARASDLALVIVDGEKGETGVRRATVFAELLALRGLLVDGRAALVVNRADRKVLFLVREGPLGRLMPVGAVLPRVGRRAALHDALARRLLALLGLRETPAERSLFGRLFGRRCGY